jgi:hypothetical protein
MEKIMFKFPSVRIGKCDICVEQNILFVNETKWYKIWLRTKKLSSKNLTNLNFTVLHEIL